MSRPSQAPSRRLRAAVAATLAMAIAAQAAAPAIAAAAPGCGTTAESFLAEHPSELSDLLKNYVQAYRGTNRLRKALFSSRIKKHIFKKAGSPEYVDSLKFIDQLSYCAPEPVYDLAKSLQLHWEAQYAVGLGEKRAQRLTTGAKIGAIVGIAILGAAMIRKPQNAGKYFRLFKQLAPIAPLAGTAAGVGTAYAINSSGLLDGNVPVAPAHVMHLGVSTDEFYYDDHELIRELVTLTAASAVAEVAYYSIRALSIANKLATPAKINPIVLVVSIVVFFAAEKGIKYYLDEREYSRFERKYTQARNIIDWGLTADDDGTVFTGADALMKSAANLAQYLNKPIYEAMEEYSGTMAEAAKKYGENSRRFQDKLLDATRELGEKIREFQSDKDRGDDHDYEATLVLGFLKNHDEKAIQDLGESARARAEQYQEAFGAYLAANEDRSRMNYGSAMRETLFQRFIDGLSRAKDRQLATEFAAGRIQRDATHVLLSAAAYLRNTGKEYVGDQADAMMALIQRNDLLMAITKNRPVSGDIGFTEGSIGYSGAEGGSGSDTVGNKL